MPQGYFTYTHLDSLVTTVKQLFTRPDLKESLFISGKDFDIEKFLSTEILLGNSDTFTVTNRQLIYNKYDTDEKDLVDFKPENITQDSLIKLNTTLYISQDNIKRDLLYTQTLNVEKTTDANAFISQKLKDLYQNVEYVKKYEADTLNGGVRKDINSLIKQSSSVQVFVWCRGLLSKEELSYVEARTISSSNSDDFSQEGSGDSTKDFFSKTEGKYGPSFSRNNRDGVNDPRGRLLSGGWIDITPHIKDLTTSNSENGGSFSFSLPPLIGQPSKTEGWVLQQETLKGDFNTSYSSKVPIHQLLPDGNLKRNQFYFHNILSENDLVYIKFEPLELESEPRNKFGDISYKDIPSITDPLTGEVRTERVYDLIGLIDINQLTSSYSSNSINISITGRDLIKPLIEDGTYFFPAEFAKGMFLGAGEADQNNSSLIRRNLSTGSINSLSVYYEKTIQDCLQFVISQLANTGFVPNDVFVGYAERRNTFTGLNQGDERRLIKQRQENRQKHNDLILENCKKARTFYRDSNARLGRPLYDGLVSDDELELESLRQLIIDFAKFIINNNLDEEQKNYESDFNDYYLSTWLPWKEGTSFRNSKATPNSSYTKNDGVYPSELSSLLYPSGIVSSGTYKGKDKSFRPKSIWPDLGTKTTGLNIIHSSVGKAVRHAYAYEKLRTEPSDIPLQKRLLQGVWQIIDLLIDNSVRNRTLVDTSIAQAQGSLLSTVKKICQEPLVEFFSDTYGDKFYYIVRKPPYDKVSVLDMVYGTNLKTEFDKVIKNESANFIGPPEEKDMVPSKSKLADRGLTGGEIAAVSSDSETNINSGVIIDIEESSVISDTLDWYNNEVYSWYRLIPKSYVFGSSSAMTWAFLPAIYFEEYCDIWGNKPYIVTTTYYPFKGASEGNQAFKQNPILTQCYYDLKYIIDSNSYLPFTRQGSLTLKGDRRIKKKTWIRLKGTGEIFYVENVKNIYNSEKLQRTTTLQVSRGMVEKFIGLDGEGITVEGITEKVSYFNIINTSLKLGEKQKVSEFEQTFNELSQTTDEEKIKQLKEKINSLSIDLNPQSVLSNFKVNKQVFDFFLQRRQFE